MTHQTTQPTTQSEGGFKPSPRPVMIDVYATLDSSGLVQFDHRWKFEDVPGDPAKSGRIDLPRANRAYTLKFKLHDESGKKLEFMKPCEAAMYVGLGSTCPTSAGDGGQIEYNHPWTPSQLMVDDLNRGDECILSYTLRFDGKAGQQASDPARNCPAYEYDPEIRNGGGG